MTPSKGSPAKKSPAKKAAKKAVSAGRSATAPQSDVGRNELVVVAHAGARLRVRSGRVESIDGAEHRSLNAILASEGVAMRPLFGPEERVIRQAELALKRAVSPVPDLSVFYGVATDGEFGGFAEQFNAFDEIAGAYVKPSAEPPVRTTAPPSPDNAPAVTPITQPDRATWAQRPTASTRVTPRLGPPAVATRSGSSTSNGDGSSVTRTCFRSREASSWGPLPSPSRG